MKKSLELKYIKKISSLQEDLSRCKKMLRSNARKRRDRKTRLPRG